MERKREEKKDIPRHCPIYLHTFSLHSVIPAISDPDYSWRYFLFFFFFFCKRYKSDNRAPFVNRELFHPVTDLA